MDAGGEFQSCKVGFEGGTEFVEFVAGADEIASG
jgi:hypothetical protein